MPRIVKKKKVKCQTEGSIRSCWKKKKEICWPPRFLTKGGKELKGKKGPQKGNGKEKASDDRERSKAAVVCAKKRGKKANAPPAAERLGPERVIKR